MANAIIDDIMIIRSFVQRNQWDGYVLSDEQQAVVARFNVAIKRHVARWGGRFFSYGTMRSITQGTEWDLQQSIPALDFYCHVSVAETNGEEGAYIIFNADHSLMFSLW